jgi:aconitate hydratase
VKNAKSVVMVFRDPPPLGRLHVAGRSLLMVDLPAHAGPRLGELPYVLRLLLENATRNMRGEERSRAIDAVLRWLARGTSEEEIAFQPQRVLMHDTTSTPALVDIAAMRDAIAEAGGDPSRLNPVLPVDVSIDHSLAVEAYGRADAPVINMGHEIRRNAERYRFLRWAAGALQGVHVHAPGTGIMHTMNLEQLASVVTTESRDGEWWAVPDTLIGTDSHTPMVNGIGVLGWGVGGLEAQTVMFGMPTMLRIPEVVGVKLIGTLGPGALATDLALTVTHRLREIDVTGAFVEFHGPGVATLTASQRAVVANMAPEYGATTGFFAVDAATIDFLRMTGRAEGAIELVEAYCRRNGLWFDPQAQPRYTRVIEIDLSRIGTHIAGPRRPQDLHRLSDARAVLDAAGFQPKTTHPHLPTHPVAIAAITSCTNTSDPGLLIAAGLLARKARVRGLGVPAWVKTSLAPGSPSAMSYLRRSGLLDDLGAIGFDIVGFGCTTCIGNAGPLTSQIAAAQREESCQAVAVLSGNRNFPGRVHPDIELSFIMSPPLVIAFALAGDARRDLSSQPVAQSAEGADVYLSELWPPAHEIEAHLRAALRPEDFARDFQAAERNPQWHELRAPMAQRYPWDARSTQLRRPPFAALDQGSLLGTYTAWPLLVVGDDVTTDHISPASAIPPDSLVAAYLVAQGDSRDDLNVFASRRGNWEVMMRAAFHNRTLRNLLAPEAAVAHTLHAPSGELLPIWEAARRYREAGESVVVVAGERYGMGSSRDWAAKGQRLLGIRAVLAVGFERIHRSNLIGMGILPLVLPEGVNPATLDIRPGDRIEVDAPGQALAPRARVRVSVLRSNGREEAFNAMAAVQTRLETELLRQGGVIPTILRKTLAPC